MPKLHLTDADMIAEVAGDLWFEQWPDWSRDELLCHPDEAAAMCVEVRRRLKRKALTQFEILWTWLNSHKRSKAALKPRKPERAAVGGAPAATARTASPARAKARVA